MFLLFKNVPKGYRIKVRTYPDGTVEITLEPLGLVRMIFNQPPLGQLPCPRGTFSTLSQNSVNC
jgi:hypothetical protein